MRFCWHFWRKTTIAMAGYGMDTRKETKVGKGVRTECRHSTGFMVWSLGHSTVTCSIEEGKARKAHSSNRDPISRDIFSNIAADIGSRRVVSA